MEVFFYIINFMNIKKLIDQAEVHKKLGEIDLALKIFEKILRKIPTNEIALINLSIINLLHIEHFVNGTRSRRHS